MAGRVRTLRNSNAPTMERYCECGVGGLVSVSECEFAIIKLSPDEFEELVGLVGRVLSACGDLCGCGVEACSVFGSL